MKVLLIEDNPGDARLVREMLNETPGDFSLTIAERLALGLDFLAGNTVELVLLDLNLPDSRGLETFTRLQALYPHLPIVIKTGSDDKALAVQAVQMGAQDYLVKGLVDSESLVRAITYAVERKRAEDAVLQAKEEWELTFNSVPDLIAILDTQHRVVRVNKAMAGRLGVTPEKCVGLHCYEAVHGTTCPPDFCPHSLTCRDGKEHTADVEEHRLGGQFHVSTTPVFDKYNRITGSIHVARDITERKRAEEALRRYAGELEATNKELEAFSYSVSHDLRAPLRSLDGFSQILLEDYRDKLDAQGREYLENIESSSQLMMQLIDDILRLSRVGRAGMSFETVDLSQLGQSIAKELIQTQPERKAEFVISPEILARGDKALLKILLHNLLGNAWKYSGKREDARIEFVAAQQDGQTVYSIKDNGVGFDVAYADKLFQPFQRLHSDKEFAGTGIGLAIVQRIVHRHRGRIWAESEVGRGATFYFTLG